MRHAQMIVDCAPMTTSPTGTPSARCAYCGQAGTAEDPLRDRFHHRCQADAAALVLRDR